jgi:drug/metabolite transporter (DMT)-like permease
MIGELAALGAALSWAIAPLMYRKALSSTKPIIANIVRSATNAVVLVAILFGAGLAGTVAGLPLWVIVAVVASGVLGLGIGDTFYMIGLKTVGVSRAVPLAASYPLFSLIWAVILLGQPISLEAVVGAVVILGGIWLLSNQKNSQETDFSGRATWRGVAVCLSAAVTWSVSISLMDLAITNSSITSLSGNYAIVTLRVASIALFLLLLAPLIDRKQELLKIKPRTVLLLCLGGLIANGLGWVLMNISFQNIVEAQAVPISSTSPLFATAAGFLFLHEKANIRTVLGAVAIVVGIALIFFV